MTGALSCRDHFLQKRVAYHYCLLQDSDATHVVPVHSPYRARALHHVGQVAAQALGYAFSPPSSSCSSAVSLPSPASRRWRPNNQRRDVVLHANRFEHSLPFVDGHRCLRPRSLSDLPLLKRVLSCTYWQYNRFAFGNHPCSYNLDAEHISQVELRFEFRNVHVPHGHSPLPCEVDDDEEEEEDEAVLERKGCISQVWCGQERKGTYDGRSAPPKR